MDYTKDTSLRNMDVLRIGQRRGLRRLRVIQCQEAKISRSNSRKVSATRKNVIEKGIQADPEISAHQG